MTKLLLILVVCFSSQVNFAGEVKWQAGAAAVDITPDYPIRLSGYGARKTVSEGVAQRIWAKALAIQSGNTGDLALIIALDNCGVTSSFRSTVAQKLRKLGIKESAFALCTTHTHSAPLLANALPNLFSAPLNDSDLSTVEGYTKELLEKIEKTAKQAIHNLAPARLSWGEGKVGFAKNRRTEGGPVHHNMPLLKVETEEGKKVALLANYACHCTTLNGNWNKIHGDWAGVAQEEIQKAFPDAVAMITIGCGADSNPLPRGTIDLVQQYGSDLAKEVVRLSNGGELKEVTQPLTIRTATVDLPFEKVPAKDQWEERARQEGIVGYHAKRNLERLARGETLPQSLPYTIQTFNFGTQLSMIFLPGEVVVDYVLRLKQEMDGERLWVNAYANDVPCYIPSKRILAEGGYEAESSLWYYDQPARLKPETEDMIIKACKQLAGPDFRRP